MCSSLGQKSTVSQFKVVIRTNKEQSEDDDELVRSVSEDVLRHGAGDERLVATVWLPPQQRLSGRFGRQGQRCKSIHDQVYPQHLHSLEGGVLERCNRSAIKNQHLQCKQG